MLLEAASAALLEASEQAVAEAVEAAREQQQQLAAAASSSSLSKWPAALALGASRWSLVGLIGRAAAPEKKKKRAEDQVDCDDGGVLCWPLDCDDVAAA